MWICDKCGSENGDDLEDCPECEKTKTPYYRKKLEQGKARDQFTTELNSQERELLEQLKRVLDFKSDPKVMKLCLEFAGNAIIYNKPGWSADTWRYVLSTNRQRLSNFQKLAEPILKENAMQK